MLKKQTNTLSVGYLNSVADQAATVVSLQPQMPIAVLVLQRTVKS